jgi:hypothetical protein
MASIKVQAQDRLDGCLYRSLLVQAIRDRVP